MSTLLDLKNINAFYGSAHILHGLSLHVNAGERVALIGRNGVGKTTVVNTILGLAQMKGGHLKLAGEAIERPRPYIAAQHGIVVVPQGRRIVANLTVEENLRLGAYLFADDRVEKDMADAFQMFPILKEKRNLLAGGLSGGQQQMLAIARALMGRPSCLLLDEPSMGLAPILVAQIFDVVKSLKALDVTVLLVEQNAFGVLSIADRGYVMETGRIAFSGSAQELIADPRVREAYLGI